MNAMERIQGFFKRCEADRELHARFANTLSYLEYVGARKIMKSQQAEAFTDEVLSHAYEEIRHAHAFKKVARELSGGRLRAYAPHELLAGESATRYFQDLDQGIADDLGARDTWRNYLYTTLLIEERANLLYPAYEPSLTAAGFPHVLRAILKEEEKHLDDITTALARAPGHAERLTRLRALEDRLFARFVDGLLTHETLSSALIMEA
jgi:hypothetical protein